MDPKPKVYVVDDDPEVGDSLATLLAPWGLQVEVHRSSEEFLEHYTEPQGRPRCLVLDVRLPGLSGMGLLKRLIQDNVHMPVILISAYSEVPLAVEAIKSGAVDFLEKPFSWQQLLDHIQAAIQRSILHLRQESERADIEARRSRLTDREQEVTELLVDGKDAKAIAHILGISDKTAMRHRARVLQKMEVANAVELARLLLSRGDGGAGGDT
jgi:FixJ family two-component response regulator